MRARKADSAWDVRWQLRLWTRISVAWTDKKGCIFDKLWGRVLHKSWCENWETSGSTQVTRIIDRQEKAIVKSNRESSNGEKLGGERRNFLSKYIVLGLALEDPKLDAKKTAQIWDRESHFWVIQPNLSFFPFIQPRQFFICRNISAEYDADRKWRGMPYMGPGGNI